MDSDSLKKKLPRTSQAKWYLVRVLPGSEDIVIAQIVSTAKVRGFSKYFEDFFYPKIVTLKEKNDSSGKEKSKEVTKKLFPGYLIIKMTMNENTNNLVSSVPKVISFVGLKGVPKALSDSEVKSFFESSEKLAEINDNNSIKLGSSIKIKSGTFSGFKAAVVALLTDTNAAKVSVLVFNTPTEIIVPLTDIELVKESNNSAE